MNKERNVIESKAIVVFDRVVKASELNKLTQSFNGDVIITKKLVVDKKVDISCNLYVMGGIVRKYPISNFDININGDLYCYGEIHCKDINVSGYFYSENVICSRAIKVGENFVCEDLINAFGCDIIVAGNLECKNVIADKIRTLGEVSIEGSISIGRAIKTGY